MYDLVIFDCDGTLVDSEHLYNSITSELLNEIGFEEYTPALCLELFAGLSWSEIRQRLEDKHKTKLPEDIIRRYIETANMRMETDLKAIEHAHDVITLAKESHKICVASNGERNNVVKSLSVTGLIEHFDDEIIFTKIQVERPKPAPDLFLFAAERMGAVPSRTLVIEDSTTGVMAAAAAGMDVIGFTGAAPDREKHKGALLKAGAHKILDSLIHIPEALKRGKDWFQ